MWNQIGGCFVQHNIYIKCIINIYRQHVSAFSESQRQAKYKMCRVVLNSDLYICLFYAKGMNKNVKMLEHGNMSTFF